ncbi:MAG: hypothetical protein M3525_10215, partial [Acidobacteriota bacterium]|nr:hypothetical protein [Acidobacteriota bacterium]
IPCKDIKSKNIKSESNLTFAFRLFPMSFPLILLHHSIPYTSCPNTQQHESFGLTVRLFANEQTSLFSASSLIACRRARYRSNLLSVEFTAETNSERITSYL